MASEATLGYGTQFFIADADGNFSLDKLGQIKDVPFPEWECDDIDITNQDSPDATKEYLSGFSDGGELEIEMVFKSAEFARLDTFYRQKRNMRICLPERDSVDATYEGTPPSSTPRIDFEGYIKKIGGSSPVEEAIMATITIKVSSKPEFTEEPAD